MSKTVAVMGFTFSHYSFYIEVIKVFQSAGYRITFYTDVKTAESFVGEFMKYWELKNVGLVVFNRCIIGELYRRRREINKHDVVFFDEYYGIYFHLALFRVFSGKKILGVHNIHKFLYLSNTNIRHFVDSFFRRLFFRQFDAAVVISANLKHYLISSNPEIRTFVIPFAGRKPLKRQKLEDESGVIKVVVPGSVDNTRRNYKDLLGSFYEYLRLKKDPKIQLIFLGQLKITKLDEVYQVITEVKSHYENNLVVWDDFVPISEYEFQMENADYLLSNINLVSHKTTLFEVYGLSKETGVSFAIYKYAKPGIFPMEQRVSYELESQLIRYSGYHDLVDVFLRIDAGYYDWFKLKRESVDNCKSYDFVCNLERDMFLDYLSK